MRFLRESLLVKSEDGYCGKVVNKGFEFSMNNVYNHTESEDK
jgi:hypothetical protein